MKKEAHEWHALESPGGKRGWRGGELLPGFQIWLSYALSATHPEGGAGLHPVLVKWTREAL